jgi:thioredoxin-related protein
MTKPKGDKNGCMTAKVLIWLAILACTLFGFDDMARAADAVPHTRDLRADARAATQNRQPLLLFITLEGCPFCARVRREYLGPMSQDADQNRRALIRELPIEATVPDFEGRPRLGRDIAADLRISMYPTVILVDATGKLLAEPLVGFTSPDFYGAYLDNRIDTAREKVDQGRVNQK